MRTQSRWLFASLLSIVGVATIAKTATSSPLTLHQAVQQALSNNPSLHLASERVVEAHTQIPLARSTLFPTLLLEGTGQNRKDAANSNTVRFDGDPYNQYTLDFKLTQPILTFGIFSGVGAQAKERDLRQLDREINARELTSQLLQSYFQMILNTRLVDTLLRQESIVKESLATAQRRERTGRGQLLDVLQVKTQIALLQSKIADARNQLEISSAQLATLMGTPDIKSITVKNILEAPELAVVDRALVQHPALLPELEQNRISIDEIADKRAVIWGQNLPKLFATADYGYTAYKKSDLLDDSGHAWSVMVTLDIPIFSGLSSLYQRQQLAAQERELYYSRKNIEDQASLQQVSNRKSLETAQASIKSGVDALELAKASSAEANRSYRLATIDFVNFLTVQQSLVEAESSLNQFKYNYLVALVKYFVASGQSLSDLLDLLEGTQK